MPRLSLVVIAKNEERDLPACLKSVRGVADELVVVDGRSVDKTAEVARAAGAKVLERHFTTYAEQKQFAVEAASGDWVLNLDADERLSPELADSILRAVSAAPGEVQGYQLGFATEFMGRRLRHGGLGGERHLRLFRRNGGRFVGGLLHEGVALEGRVDTLPGEVLHRPYEGLTDYLEKLNRYTTLAAEKSLASGRRFRWWHHLLLPAEFFKRYVLQLGVLDGVPGFTWCALSAFYAWVKYSKLKELQGRSEP